jgi:hypothetical protein
VVVDTEAAAVAASWWRKQGPDGLPQLLGVSGTSVSVVDIARERRELQHPVKGKSML